jgi:hypothetical protein
MLRVFKHAQAHNGARHQFFSRSEATSKKQRKTAADKKRKTDVIDAQSAIMQPKKRASKLADQQRKSAVKRPGGSVALAEAMLKLKKVHQKTTAVQLVHSPTSCPDVAENTVCDEIDRPKIGTSQF